MIKYTVRKKFGTFIREERVAKGVSLRQMAKSIGVSPAYLSKVELGQERPPVEAKVRRIAKIIGHDADSLLAKAGRVSFDIVRIIGKRPELSAQLRASEQLPVGGTSATANQINQNGAQTGVPLDHITSIIRAGTMAELRQRGGDWAFVDVGFSRSSKTCGFLHVPGTAASRGEPTAVTLRFGELVRKVVELAQQDGPPLHLVLEAPLSAAFGADGNPLGRSVEKQASATRYWYAGLGCSVLVASLYLLKAVSEARPAREVRLYEGFVSFKDSAKASNHVGDVQALKAVVWSGGLGGGAFHEPAPLEGYGNALVTSTLALLGLDANPPPIIEGIIR